MKKILLSCLAVALGFTSVKAQVPVTVSGEITTNTTWTKNNIYLLNGFVYVEDGATLTIEAGTLIKGDKATKGTLIVTKTGTIQAAGTECEPIVFTSNEPAGTRNYGDWGGIIILGEAPINVAGGSAVIEGGVDIEGRSDLIQQLHDAGIEHAADELLIFRRELSAAGKSRAFINQQPVQAALIKELSSSLLEIVGQHANQKLLSNDSQRQIVDTFGELETYVKAFASRWQEEIALQKELNDLVSGEAQRLREIEICRMEMEELEQADLKEGEDEELFSEYSRLAHSEEIAGKINDLLETLNGERHGVLPLLTRQKQSLESLAKLDPALDDTVKSFINSLLELQETSFTLTRYQGRLECSPERTQELNERLTLIIKLKRKFGKTVADILSYKDQIASKLDSLENCDSRIEELQANLAKLSEENQRTLQHLTEKRKKAAAKLEKEVTKQLVQLNMPKVVFEIDISAQTANRTGADQIEFKITPNVGEKSIPVKECASGGELSRLLLALQVLMAGKEQLSTLVFDEIDANIGGATANIVGEKLKEISHNYQLLCITHFPQVAQHAEHHFQISKEENEGRTLTTVTPLAAAMRRKELERMAGVT